MKPPLCWHHLLRPLQRHASAGLPGLLRGHGVLPRGWRGLGAAATARNLRRLSTSKSMDAAEMRMWVKGIGDLWVI